MSFKVIAKNGKLELRPCKGDSPKGGAPKLSEEKKAYLQEYIAQVNRYKVIGFFRGSPVTSLYQPPLATAAGIRSLEHRLKRRFDNVRIPATATISITKACQCNCSHCSAVYYNRSAKRVLSKEEFQEAFRQTVDLGVTTIIILGGEPLLRKDLENLIAGIPQKKAVSILFTNGEFLTLERCQQLKDAGLMGAFVSLDSTNAEKHDRLRRRCGLFYRALLGIENLQRVGLLAGISSYLSPQRLQENGFEEMMGLGKKVGVHEVTFFDAIPSGQWLKDDSCCLTPKDRTTIEKLTHVYRKKEGYPGLSVQSTMTSPCGSTFCFAANTQFYLTAFGDMCPCDFTPLTIGKFPDHSIHELWEKMITTPPYNNRAKSCRMQDPDFRSRYIQPIPAEGPFPYPLNEITGARENFV